MTQNFEYVGAIKVSISDDGEHINTEAQVKIVTGKGLGSAPYSLAGALILLETIKGIDEHEIEELRQYL